MKRLTLYGCLKFPLPGLQGVSPLEGTCEFYRIGLSDRFRHSAQMSPREILVYNGDSENEKNTVIDGFDCIGFLYERY